MPLLDWGFGSSRYQKTRAGKGLPIQKDEIPGVPGEILLKKYV